MIASGTSPVTVFHAAEATGLHPFFICVGREEEPCRIRRAAFPYDASYPGESLQEKEGWQPAQESGFFGRGRAEWRQKRKDAREDLKKRIAGIEYRK
ncbi:MAG: hypothetical protein ACHRXM_00425 [Isosphaerales bacterium]